MTAADYADTHIHCPAMSIFGTSTDAEFWSVLQGSEVENGFFSRFLVLSSNHQAPEQDPLGDPFEVPAGALRSAWRALLLGRRSLDDCTTE